MKAHTIAALAMVMGFMLAGHAMQKGSPDVLAKVDHLVYATPDLTLGIDTLERLLDSMVARPDVLFWQGTQIHDWYLATGDRT